MSRGRRERGTVWQGIRDWFRPGVQTTARTASRRAEPSLRSGGTAIGSESVSEGRTTEPHLLHRSSAGGVVADLMDQSDMFLGTGGDAVMDFAAEGPIDDQELLDFLAADVDPVPVDPVFRDRLREELWQLVLEEGIGHPTDD